MYQTVFATEPGSAEMPSAGPAVHAGAGDAARLARRRRSRRCCCTPASPAWRITNRRTKSTTACRATRPSASAPPGARAPRHRRRHDRRARSGNRHRRQRDDIVPGEGWTDLVITPDRPLRSVNGLITGLHEPRATHLSLLESVSGRRHLERAYGEARRLGYLWHEFGDSHLILGRATEGRRAPT